VNAAGFQFGHLGGANVEDMGPLRKAQHTRRSGDELPAVSTSRPTRASRAAAVSPAKPAPKNHNPAVFTAPHWTMLAAERQRL